MREGDIVAIILCLEVPMLLREMDDERYKTVGETYLHGTLNGEVMDEEGAKVGKILLK